MTPSPLRDLLVGAFVLAGMLAIAYLSIPVGDLSLRSTPTMRLYATFDEVGGLKPRAQVVIGGVKVGQVGAVGLGSDFRPLVSLEIDPSLKIPDDSSASILTAGVLGDQYVAIEPGGSDTYLAAGGDIAYTQSAVVLERLLGKFIQNLGGSNNTTTQ